MRRKNLDKDEKDLIREMYELGSSPSKIAERVKCSNEVACRHINMIQNGFENVTQYLDSLAREKGYESHYKMVEIRRILKGNGEISAQEKFEQEMERGGLGVASRNGYVGSEVLDFDYFDKCNKALNVLAERHYSQGRVVYGHPNPNRAIEVQVIKEYYYGGETLKELGKKLGVTKEGVRQIRNKGLKHLRHIINEEV